MMGSLKLYYLDKKVRTSIHGIGIGVLTVRPKDFQLPTRAYELPHAWMYQNSHIYSNGTRKCSYYGLDLYKLLAGTRFAVMKKSSNGDVHFFINGADKGSAVSGICSPVYGVVELNGRAKKMIILKP